MSRASVVDDLLGDFGLGVVLHQHFHGEPSQMVGKVLHVRRQVVDGIGTDVFQVTQDLRLGGGRSEEPTARGAEDPSTLDDIQGPSGLARRNPVVAEPAADVVLSGLG